ncbi:hypothetical protein [Jiella avicenniae]|uniref:Tat pathway signal sequence domain protein n=1 Tax=Jiella avicenniae TaxID=2907202 RepID=A0A9X1NZU9_9HYPH|nr:hypothetical protein [Jiella avicenniae]MCE7027660.1 hypothetical protein [Jiella avicenniae]MCE7028702.1 hypothetical protein [Jiella avicenniae]
MKSRVDSKSRSSRRPAAPEKHPSSVGAFARTAGRIGSAALVAAGLALGGAPALAQDGGTPTGDAATGTQPAAQNRLGLELNNAVDDAGLCRLSYVAVNGTGQPLEKVSYDVVVFDTNGQVSQFLVLQFGQLPAGKTKVVQFDLADQPCAGISRILVNDVAECETAQGSAAICMDALEPTSRTAITFDT